MIDPLEPLFNDQPAAYPKTAATEARSRNTLAAIMDPNYIRGELRIMDKYPNSDGILEVTDIKGITKGKIDVQLKTLGHKDQQAPKYSCDRPFLAYCQNSLLPVILIVVDNDNQRAYWLHMNFEVLSNVQSAIKGKTYSISIPVGNVIVRNSLDYVNRWTAICQAVFQKVWNYDALNVSAIQMEQELLALRQQILPLDLKVLEIIEIQTFLDLYNDLLDHDFRIVKQGLYHTYWKIGLGIIRYSVDSCAFTVFPVPYGVNDLLIKQLRPGSIQDIDRQFVHRKILRMQSNSSINPISQEPERLAYELIQSDFNQLMKSVQFEIPDDFMANEYIHGFVNNFSVLLGMEKNLEQYDLPELKEIIDAFPLLLEIILNIPDGPKRINYSIDGFRTMKPSELHQNRLKDAQQRFRDGYTPRFEVLPTSEMFHVDILAFYINHLLNQGIGHSRRVYDPNTRIQVTGGFIWDSWNNEVMIQNLSIFFENFNRIFQLFINQHFPLLTSELNLFQRGNLRIYCLSFEHGRHAGPQLEYYVLKSRSNQPNGIRFYTDDTRTFRRDALFSHNGWIIKIDKKTYDLYQSGGAKIGFIFDALPAHNFIKELAKEMLADLFKEKLRKPVN